MFTKLKIKTDQKLNINTSSLIHGAILECISEEYGDFLHNNNLHPYAFHLEEEEGKSNIIISTIGLETKENIINKIVRLDSFHLKKQNITIMCKEKAIEIINIKDLTYDSITNDKEKYIRIKFLTPTSFKSNNEYIMYPFLDLLYKSLFNKYNIGEDSSNIDEETFNYIISHSKIISYNLRTNYFSLENTKIPAFIGEIKIRFSGTQTMANFVHLLFKYGEYLGVGIKCSMGMGGVKIVKDK